MSARSSRSMLLDTVTLSACLAGLWLFTGCEHTGAHPELPGPTAQASKSHKPEASRASEDDLKAYIRELVSPYEQWPQVSRTIRWSPEMCRAEFPPYKQATSLRISRAGEQTPHGRKLYLLHARFADGYALSQPSPGGYLTTKDEEPIVVTPVKHQQTIVKRTWKPERTSLAQSTNAQSALVVVGDDGFAYQRGEPGDVFVMTKLETDSQFRALSDEGWIYAVLSADASTVIQAGRIGNCMACHVHARHERLFGPALD